MIRQDILNFLEILRDSVPNAVEVYTKGNCTSLAILLSMAFPGGVILHNIDHAVYELNNIHYDITGLTEKPKGVRPLKEYGVVEIMQLMKNNYEE